MLRLVHLGIELTVLLVQLAGHRVGLRRSFHVIVKEARALVLQGLRSQLRELMLNDFRYFQLEHTGERLQFGHQDFINFRF